MFWLVVIVIALVVAYRFRVQLLARVLGQPESRIQQQLERRKRK